MTTLLTTSDSSSELATRLRVLRGNRGLPPDLSVVIPVNAQGDLENVVTLLTDIATYSGPHSVEIVLVVNNYEPTLRPLERERELSLMGVELISMPTIRRPGEAVAFTARTVGFQAAQSDSIVTTDSDCRISDPTAWLNWYAAQFSQGAAAAYGHIAYVDVSAYSIRVKIALHHLARWIKRVVFRIPTTMGANYGLRRSIAMRLYSGGMLADEMNVGPAIKRAGHKVSYSAESRHAVLTSARMFRPGWLKLLRYAWRRFWYNARVLTARSDVARVTGRENDPVRRFINNKPLT
jgi:hypothetical protein